MVFVCKGSPETREQGFRDLFSEMTYIVKFNYLAERQTYGWYVAWLSGKARVLNNENYVEPI